MHSYRHGVIRKYNITVYHDIITMILNSSWGGTGGLITEVNIYIYGKAMHTHTNCGESAKHPF